MERIRILPLLLCATFLVFHSKSLAQPSQRPLCASQFALVNYACAALPYMPPSPPSPPPPEEDSHENGHGHRHRRRHRHHHHETQNEENCCRWLKELDDECVCDLLIHLPPFLSRPAHAYSIIVDDACNVTYSCGGRLIP
ncbi:hypothetical protein K2173_004696 [Erythroxylum novogranatense]|uniref:Bifunctional inhibitor/plant lipid transfer protein/seed storage helical domain-containing protein n=1 Tax=Erythroxylum novogranatense TaxID=1862640 RepID=A0AAV8UBI3_9ROSI|nr:hypothetical protein K2173_004696 [Erythroxylum novogranatense]